MPWYLYSVALLMIEPLIVEICKFPESEFLDLGKKKNVLSISLRLLKKYCNAWKESFNLSMADRMEAEMLYKNSIVCV